MALASAPIFARTTSSALGLRSRFKVASKERREPLTVEINLAGLHNVLNSLAAVAVAAELEISDAALKRALGEFSGVERRLQVNGTVTTAAGRVTFVDDYGHHPTELAATIAAARGAWPSRRLVVVFQPHRYTRTHALLDDFAQVLSVVDALVLTNVYSAGETPLAGADGKSLARAVRVRGSVEPIFIEELGELPAVLAQILRADDVVLTLGAGSIGAIAPNPAAGARRARAGRGAEMSAMVEEVPTHAEPLRNEPMRRHTSWRVGGPADLFYEPDERRRAPRDPRVAASRRARCSGSASGRTCSCATAGCAVW